MTMMMTTMMMMKVGGAVPQELSDEEELRLHVLLWGYLHLGPEVDLKEQIVL
jgi:hypothetical protein